LPLFIDKKSPSLRVIQALRDEAHRFGITHHRLRRSKGQTVSELDSISGVGPVTSKMLMRTFKSVKRLKEVPLEELQNAVGKSKGKIVYSYFHPETNPE
jgi:excinuclease ABC subunit C